MKELIPLKKDITFNTKISEITSLDVEHDYKIENDSVNGKLILSGTYKMTEASLLEEEFYYELPFTIAIGTNIIKDSINIEISDFKYELKSNIMKVNAEFEFNCDREEIEMDNSLNDYFKDDVIIEDKEEKIDTKEDISNNISESFMFNEEKYNTYKVYIFREGDSIENICVKYNVKLEDVKEYNDITNINIGDKIIIPYIHNEV